MSAAISDPVRRRLLGRALSLSMAVAPFGLAFGVLCAQAGLHPLTALGFSVLVFTGSAQFAAVAVLANAGTVAAAVVAGLLLNVRCLAFGLVMAPVFPRSWARRVLASQLMIDESMAVGTSVDERGCSVGPVSPPVNVGTVCTVERALGPPSPAPSPPGVPSWSTPGCRRSSSPPRCCGCARRSSWSCSAPRRRPPRSAPWRRPRTPHSLSRPRPHR